MRRLVIDLDGTICEQTKGGDDYYLAKPNIDVVSRLRDYRSAGWYVVILTARGMKTFDGDVIGVEDCHRERTESWLHFHGIPYDELIFGKPSGDLYVDDKGARPDEFINSKPL